jgi:NADPH:quinone reductase-like Zn-dependent oxidoreductase
MTNRDAVATMRTVRFREYGEPGDVLHLETAPVPEPGPDRIRVAVHAGDTYAQRLRDFGAVVTSYGAGLVERVRAVTGGPVDVVLDTAPAATPSAS